MTPSGKVDNSVYRSNLEIGAGRLKQVAWYLVNVLCFQNPLNVSSAIKRGLLRLFGAQVGKGVVIKPSVNIKYPWKLRVGDYSWIGEKVWIDNLAEVTLGNHACLSQGAMLLTGNHDYSKTSFDLIVKKITCEDGVWIGAQSMVAPGVHCGTHAVLAASSVATKDLEPYGVYQGNPAVKVKDRIIAD